MLQDDDNHVDDCASDEDVDLLATAKLAEVCSTLFTACVSVMFLYAERGAAVSLC